MSRKAILTAMLAVSLGVFAQRSGAPGGTPATGTSGSGTGTSASQAGTPTTQGAVGGVSGQAAAGPITPTSANTAGTPTLPAAMAGPSGTTGSTQANPDNLNNNSGTFNNGFVGTGAVGSGVLSTPGGTFASPAPTAGISDAGRAGISANTPMNTGVQSSLENSTVVYTNGAPVNPNGVNISTAANTPGRAINDLGPSFYSDVVAGSVNAVSLGEVAAQIKASKTAVNARMLTNDDVEKMVSRSTGVTVAKNMPPLSPGAAPQSGTSQTASAQNGVAQSAQGGTSASQQGQTSAAGQQRAGTPPPVETNQGQAAGSEATAGTSTTPQINQNQQSNDAQGRSRLPATSTLLPLLGLLGAVSGGLGLWYRRFRK